MSGREREKRRGEKGLRRNKGKRGKKARKNAWKRKRRKEELTGVANKVLWELVSLIGVSHRGNVSTIPEIVR